MPELCRFYGIIIRMYFEAMEPHHTPHFHAYYQEEVAVYKIIRLNYWRGLSRNDNKDSLKRGRNSPTGAPAGLGTAPNGKFASPYRAPEIKEKLKV